MVVPVLNRIVVERKVAPLGIRQDLLVVKTFEGFGCQVLETQNAKVCVTKRGMDLTPVRQISGAMRSVWSHAELSPKEGLTSEQ